MAVTVECPRCRHTQKIDDDRADKETPCKICHFLIQPAGAKPKAAGKTKLAGTGSPQTKLATDGIQPGAPAARKSATDKNVKATPPKVNATKKREKDDDDDDDRPRPSRNPTAKSKDTSSNAMMYVIGGGIAFLFLLVVCGSGLGVMFLMSAGKKAVPPLAQINNPLPAPVIIEDIPNPIPKVNPRPVDPNNPGGEKNSKIDIKIPKNPPADPAEKKQDNSPKIDENSPKGKGLPNNAGWNVVADPGQLTKGPFNLADSIPLANEGVVFTSTPSPFALIPVRGPNRVFQVYDLRVLRPVGVPLQISALVNFTLPALSPDGKHVSARVKDGESSAIEVWSTATGQSIRKFATEDTSISPKYSDLLGNNRLWIAKHKGEFPLFSVKTTFEVWDIESGNLVSRFTNPLVPDKKWFCFSPGQRYQWLEQTGGWYLHLVWDLQTGKMVGEREFLPKGASHWGIASGMCVSTDGEEFAMLWQDRMRDRDKSFGKLMCWEIKSGTKLLDHRLANYFKGMHQLGLPDSECIQWWPERRGWLLFGHVLLDRDSGAPVYTIGRAPTPGLASIQNRRFLDAFHLTQIDGGIFPQLKIIALPRKEIEASVMKARADAK